MNSTGVELALGTVQFGMAYGIAGRREPIPLDEARSILAKAWEFGIRTLDTAPAYGNIEERLMSLIENYSFNMVSKIPAIPNGLGVDAIENFVGESIFRTQARLGAHLGTLLFHRCYDLLEEKGDIAWQAASHALTGSTVRLGVSCYSPAELAVLCEKFPIKAAQIPGNAFDQRVVSLDNLHGIELYLRSVFLQGLLLMSLDAVSSRIPQANAAIEAWRNWCFEHELTPLEGALSIAKGLPGIRYCVVGVDNLSQLEEISCAWVNALPLQYPDLAIHRDDIIDPRCWPKTV